jgi:hypothetical protein
VGGLRGMRRYEAILVISTDGPWIPLTNGNLLGQCSLGVLAFATASSSTLVKSY